jgi:tetratricopeptide (TPR) repeat protein
MSRGSILSFQLLILALLLTFALVSAESPSGNESSSDYLQDIESTGNLSPDTNPLALEIAVKEWNAKGYAAFKKREYEDAIAAYDQALLISPNNSISLIYLAESLYYLEDYELSLEVFENAFNASVDEHQIDIARSGITKTKRALNITESL